MKKFFVFAFALFAIATIAQAQMSYQVSLLNTATGEPRANVTVNAGVTITNSANEQVYTTQQSATSNDLGILQLIVGNAETFKNLDTGKLPLFIEVTVDGITIGKSQIMTVPAAEVATTLKSSFTKEDLIGTWSGRTIYESGGEDVHVLLFSQDKVKLTEYGAYYSNGVRKEYVNVGYIADYEVEGNNIYIFVEGSLFGDVDRRLPIYRFHNNKLYGGCRYAEILTKE